MRKNYVLDTNTLILSPDSIYGFEDNNVYITTTTLQELDGLKTAPGETGWGARDVIRKIEACRKRGKLCDGVELDNGGMLYTLRDVADIGAHLPRAYKNSPDNTIIATTKALAEHSGGVPTILVTNDVSMRINADDCDVQVQDYRNDRVETDEIYTGKTEMHVVKSIIDELCELPQGVKPCGFREKFTRLS
jgi:PhoH-like ATPase